MRLKNHVRLLGLLAGFAALAVWLNSVLWPITRVLVWSHPAPGLTRKDVVEIKVGAWRAALHDLVPSSSAKDLRSVPEKLLFIYWVERIIGSRLPKPNEAGFLFCGPFVPGTRDDLIVNYGAAKVQGRWMIRRMPTSVGSWHELSAALAQTDPSRVRRSRHESR